MDVLGTSLDKALGIFSQIKDRIRLRPLFQRCRAIAAGERARWFDNPVENTTGCSQRKNKHLAGCNSTMKIHGIVSDSTVSFSQKRPRSFPTVLRFAPKTVRRLRTPW